VRLQFPHSGSSILLGRPFQAFLRIWGEQSTNIFKFPANLGTLFIGYHPIKSLVSGIGQVTLWVKLMQAKFLERSVSII